MAYIMPLYRNAEREDNSIVKPPYFSAEDMKCYIRWCIQTTSFLTIPPAQVGQRNRQWLDPLLHHTRSSQCNDLFS